MMAAKSSRLPTSTPVTASRPSVRIRAMASAISDRSRDRKGESTARITSRLPTKFPTRRGEPSGSSGSIKLTSIPAAATARRYRVTAAVTASPPS